jgi:membrane-bound serine protease (ClpP class)
MSPNVAFCLVMLGVLGIYSEFIWPGRVLPGIGGAAAAVTGAHFLWRATPTALGLELLAAAGTIFVLDALADTCFAAGVVATTALAFGFVKLIVGGHGIRPVLAVPWCLMFGAATTWLNWAGRRARRNKQF